MEEKLQVREGFARVIRGVRFPRLSLWRLGLRGPLHASVTPPWSDALQLPGAWVLSITKWGPFLLGVAGLVGLQVFQVFRYTWSSGWKGWRAGQRVRAAPGYHGVSYLEGALESFHFKEAPALGEWVY